MISCAGVYAANYFVSNDGRQLEELVALIERLLLPQGFEVKPNARVFNEEGVQIAEFDIEIRGKLGSTDIAWLIECRDRPGQGPASGAWIEQLVGRRSRFGFNKVTAVSTSGFAQGAIEYAQRAGVETREVKDLTPEYFSDWLGFRNVDIIETQLRLDRAILYIAETESEDRQKAALEAISGKPIGEQLLRSSETGETISILKTFEMFMASNPAFSEGAIPNQPGKPVEVKAIYASDKSHPIIDTALGPVRITEILFGGEVTLVQSQATLARTQEYTRTESTNSISQSAGFMIPMNGQKFSLEMHRLTETREIHLVVRKLED